MLQNQRGVTLVELLAAITLLSIVLLLIGNVHISGQKQYIKQSEQVEKQSTVRYATNVITRNIRRSNNITVSENELSIDSDKYKLVKEKIMKNNHIFVEDIKTFNVEKKDKKITLTITSASNQKNPPSLSTVIYVRE